MVTISGEKKKSIVPLRSCLFKSGSLSAQTRAFRMCLHPAVLVCLSKQLEQRAAAEVPAVVKDLPYGTH